MVGEDNREHLKGIATGGSNGDCWYEANRGAAIVEAIKKIIGKVVDEASLRYDITDSIDEAFYPVAADGTPLQAGQMINMSGELITSVPSDGKYGVITKDGNTYGVKWSNQLLAYNETGAPTWEGKFFVKAKEDFLGGNTINTNAGTNDKFTPKKYVVNGQEYDLIDEDNTKLVRTFETPYVNVDELSLTQHSTDWTVYLGTEVAPIEQLKALYDQVLVKEVVKKSKDSNWMITDSADMLGGSDTDESETFPLAHSIGELSNTDWQTLLDGRTITRDYGEYGHAHVGTVEIKLSKSGSTADYNTHGTSKTGQAVEQYVLEVVYTPDPVQDVAYHTTPGGSPGMPTDEMRSMNPHLINMYAKSLTINKVDQENNPITTSPAEFKLYRKAISTDTTYASNVPECLPAGNYVLVDTVRTSSGETTTDILNKAREYYLVETKAPDGYNPLPGYLKVTVDTEGQSLYTKTLDPTQTSTTKWNPWVHSGWVEGSSIVVEGENGAEGYVEYGPDKGVPLAYDSEATNVTYKIRNDAGVVLPAAGGPGLLPVYLLGAALVAAAGMVLARRNEA